MPVPLLPARVHNMSQDRISSPAGRTVRVSTALMGETVVIACA